MSLKGVIVVAAAANAVSYAAWYVTCWHKRGVDIYDVNAGTSTGKAIYLIGGCMSRTAKPFRFITERIGRDIPADTSVHYVEYRNLGLDVEAARLAIQEHIDKRGYREVTFVAVSMGYQLTMGVARECDKVIGLNPCVGARSLAPKMRKLIPVLPAAWGLSIAAGWLMQLPIVKVDGPAYSLQLVLDQLSICASSAHVKFGLRPDVIVLSIYDELVDKDALLRLARQGERRRSRDGSLAEKTKDRWMELLRLPTGHFGVGENHHDYEIIMPFLKDGGSAK